MSITRYDLPQSEIPTHWYNIQADLPRPLPPVLHPGTHQPVGPADLAPLFPMALIMQEVSQDRYIEIPEEVREIYKLWRPTPLLRARRLEKALDTPAHIYYKYEGVSPSGSHKLNTATPQAYYNKQEGVSGLTTETGAGQWGTALAQACNFFGMECVVYMVKVSYQQKPYRRVIMQTFGASVYASPSDLTNAGRAILAQHPDSTGSLGIAISEAVEAAVTSGGKYKYALGSVLNHVLMHQTVIGQEAIKQMEIAGEYPDVVIGCAGGGSNFAGIALPFVREKLVNGKNTRIIAVEPAACPSLTRGRMPTTSATRRAWLRWSRCTRSAVSSCRRRSTRAGCAITAWRASSANCTTRRSSKRRRSGSLKPSTRRVKFARSEGIVPAPEPSHAIAAAIREALAAKQAGEPRVILFNLCGHGHFDMAAYEAYLNGSLSDYEYPQADIEAAMAQLPVMEA